MSQSIDQISENETSSTFSIMSLFSFSGRISRGTFWITWVLLQVIFGVILLGVYAITDPDENRLAGAFLIICSIVLMWIFFSVSVRRLHDIGYSGWWLVLFLVGIGGLHFVLLVLHDLGSFGVEELLILIDNLGRLSVLVAFIWLGVAKGINGLNMYEIDRFNSLVKRGNLNKIQFLLATYPDIVNIKNHDGDIPLHFAALYGKVNVMDLFVMKGVDINSRNNENFTPLHYAAQEGHLNIAEFLITHGADINAKTNNGFTPLYIATKKKREAVANLLRKHGGIE